MPDCNNCGNSIEMHGTVRSGFDFTGKTEDRSGINSWSKGACINGKAHEKHKDEKGKNEKGKESEETTEENIPFSETNSVHWREGFSFMKNRFFLKRKTTQCRAR